MDSSRSHCSGAVVTIRSILERVKDRIDPQKCNAQNGNERRASTRNAGNSCTADYFKTPLSAEMWPVFAPRTGRAKCFGVPSKAPTTTDRSRSCASPSTTVGLLCSTPSSKPGTANTQSQTPSGNSGPSPPQAATPPKQPRKETHTMSLAQLESQIDDLRAQAASIQNRWARTSDQLASDNTLSDTGRRAKSDSEHQRVSAQLSDLRRKEIELIAAMKQSLEATIRAVERHPQRPRSDHRLPRRTRPSSAAHPKRRRGRGIRGSHVIRRQDPRRSSARPGACQRVDRHRRRKRQAQPGRWR
jgi:hypothetical protein